MDERSRLLAIGAGCAVLTLIFLLAGFPYDRLESRVVFGIERAVGGRMHAAESSQRFGITGLAYEWEGVRITGATKQAIDIERLSTRLAWSTSWLRLTPAYYVELEAPFGSASGVVNLGSRPGFDGQLEQFDLGILPDDWTIADINITGRADGTVDVTIGDHWMGDAQLEVSAGGLLGKRMRSGLTFDELDADLQFAGDHRTEIRALHISSPLLQADLTGTIGPAAEPGKAPLDLALALDADVRATSLLHGLGIRLSKKGLQNFTISGTVDAPQVR